MRTLILGSGGFVGSNLESPFFDEALKPSSQVCNLADLKSVTAYLDGTQPKYIVNMAARVGGFQYNKVNNVELLRANSLIALNIATAIKKLRLKCYYLYVSSACVYDNNKGLESEMFDGDPNSNNYGYGHSKRLGQKVISALHLDCPDLVKTCTLIPTNMYGPHDEFDEYLSHVIPNLIRQMCDEAEEIRVLGNPYNEREFMYAADLGFAIKYCLMNDIEGIYNVSTSNTVSIKELVETLVEVTGYKGKIIYSEEATEGTKDIRKLNNANLVFRLGLAEGAFTDLKEGLKKTVEWYNQPLRKK